MTRRALLLALAALGFPFGPARAASSADLVVLDKEARRLRLMRDGRTIRTFRVSLGFDPVGHKQREGDGRTPEGLYVIDDFREDSGFYRALQISYPNAWDRRRAEGNGEDPGGQIMIHGLPGGRTEMEMEHGTADWTNGCIAVTNREMDEVVRLVPVGTPVLIRK